MSCFQHSIALLSKIRNKMCFILHCKKETRIKRQRRRHRGELEASTIVTSLVFILIQTARWTLPSWKWLVWWRSGPPCPSTTSATPSCAQSPDPCSHTMSVSLMSDWTAQILSEFESLFHPSLTVSPFFNLFSLIAYSFLSSLSMLSKWPSYQENSF